jgi:hypothetical protein
MPDDFVIEAEAAWLILADRVQSLRIIARVKDPDGKPVTGLKKSNFSVVEPFQAKVTSSSQLREIVTAPGWESLPGTYQLFLDPSLEVRGQVVFILRVKKTQSAGQFAITKAGQTLIAVVKLE